MMQFDQQKEKNAMARTGRIVNRSGLAEAFGKSLSTVDAWVRAGMPVAMHGGRGDEYAFDTAECFDWAMRREREAVTGSPDDPRRRVQSANAELKEFQVGEKRGTLIHVDAAGKALERRLGVLKSRLMALPDRIASKVHDPDVAERVSEVARAEVVEALADLSGKTIVGDTKAARDLV